MRPVDAAVVTARRFGVLVERPVVLSDSNNVVVWLVPTSLVAKVGTGRHGRLGHELAVGSHLCSVGAPIVPPATTVPAQVHVCDGFEITFWEYHPRREEPVAPPAIAEALFEFHCGLATYDHELPSFRAEFDAVSALLANNARLPALADRDRKLLASQLDALVAMLDERRPANQCLHGSPHDGNVIVVAGAPRFIDFETVCVGPLEWDLAHVEPAVANAYQGIADPDALRLCRGLVSVKTAAWCWARVDDPGMRWHAQHHLDLVRRLPPIDNVTRSSN